MRREVVMTSHRGMRKNVKGAALFMVVSMMSLVILMVMFAYMLAVGAQRKAISNYQQNQSYVSARNVLDIYSSYLLAADTSDLIAGANGIGITSRDAMRSKLDTMAVNDTLVLGSNILADSAYAGMGKVNLTVTKESTTLFTLKATTVIGDGTSNGERSSTVTKQIKKVKDPSMGLFENAMIAINDATIGAANGYVFGGVVSMNTVGNTDYAAGTTIVGDCFSAGNVSIIKNDFVLQQQIKTDNAGNKSYIVDTFEVKGNLSINPSGGSGSSHFCNLTDSTLTADTSLDWPKGTTPYILVKGDLTINTQSGNQYFGYNYNPATNTAGNAMGKKVNIYVMGNLIIPNGTNNIMINGDLKVHGNTSGYTSIVQCTGSFVQSGAADPIITDGDESFSAFKPENYVSVHDFMNMELDGSGTVVDDSNTTADVPRNRMNAAIGTTEYDFNTPGITTITTSGTFKNTLNNDIVIDISGYNNTNPAHKDLWFLLDSSFKIQDGKNIWVNYGAVPLKERVNIYFYSPARSGTVNVTMGNCSVGLDIRDGGATIADGTSKTPYVHSQSAYTTASVVHAIGTNIDETTAELPSTLFWILDDGNEILMQNGSLYKGYIYGPTATVTFSNGGACKKVTYDGIEYKMTGKQTYYVGSVIANILDGSFNDGAPLYVKPFGSLLDKADSTTDYKWKSTDIYNNH